MTAIFDTHAHYDDDAFNDDREQLLAALPGDRKSTRLNSSHRSQSRMPSSA